MKSLFVGLCASFILTGCVSNNEYTRVVDQNKFMSEELSHIREDNKRLKTELASALGIAEDFNQREATYREWLEELQAMIEEKPEGIQLLPGTGNTVVFRVENTLLFAPGSVEVSPKGLESIKTVAQKLVKAGGKIRIDGHTDNQPIKNPATKAIASSNLELSVKRAIAVAKILKSVGVKDGNISVAGYGQYAPVAKNGAKGNAKNRRVDIVWIPAKQEKAPTIGTVSNKSKTPKNTTQKPEETKTQK